MSILELLNALSNATLTEAATLCTKEGQKDVYLAWGKEKGHTVASLNKVWKEVQPVKGTAGAAGFATEYYDWLSAEIRTEQEATDYIMAESNSANVKKHLSHYLNIWALAESVRCGSKVYRTGTKPSGTAKGKAKSKAEPEWEYDESNPFADVRSAKETLKREMKRAKPRKTRVHPDKVSKFKDENLTELFTEAFKKLFG